MKFVVDGKKNAVFMINGDSVKVVMSVQDLYRSYFDVPAFVKHWESLGVSVEVVA